jgi:hypothetical protein
MKTEPKIEQWMRDTEREYYRDGANFWPGLLAGYIARHAPANQPAPSIWRPISQKPTEEDSIKGKWITGIDTDGLVVGCCFEYPFRAGITHWTRTADLLAACPLPRELSQEEKDEEWVAKLFKDYDPVAPSDVIEAIKFGRATAKGAAQ